jgi:RNA polymerase sigma-70 factor (ECF subfamily)
VQRAAVHPTVAEPAEGSPREAAFRALADRHLDASYRLARAIVGDASDAQDAVHDAFVTAWQKWSTLRDPSRFEPWFQRILVNTCRNLIRRRSRLTVTSIPVEDATIGADDADAGMQDRDLIGTALARLDADHRVVLALRYHRDLTVDEIARLLAIPAGTVKSRLHHAQRRLATILEADAGPGGAR